MMQAQTTSRLGFPSEYLIRAEMPNVRIDSQKDLSVDSASYHLDDLNIQDKESVDPFELPDHDTAAKLLDAYLVSVHPSFPIVGKETLVTQHSLVFGIKSSYEPGNKILAILNLAF